MVRAAASGSPTTPIFTVTCGATALLTYPAGAPPMVTVGVNVSCVYPAGAPPIGTVGTRVAVIDVIAAPVAATDLLALSEADAPGGVIVGTDGIDGTEADDPLELDFGMLTVGAEETGISGTFGKSGMELYFSKSQLIAEIAP